MELRTAYRHCAEVTRRSGSSFASAFWMLRPERRRAIQAIYAFCRLADDIADDPTIDGDRRRLLDTWRRELELAYLQKAEHPVGVALSDVVHRYRLPEELFIELLRGVESDLNAETFKSFEELRRYCYRVASTVGLLVVRILGARNAKSFEYAEAMGIGVQLTNILRDIGEDASEGRIYLPQSDLQRFSVTPESIFARERSDGLRYLLSHTAERARLHYDAAALALPDEDRKALRPAEAMGRIYQLLLDRLQAARFPCFETPLRLSKTRRVLVAASVWLGSER